MGDAGSYYVQVKNSDGHMSNKVSLVIQSATPDAVILSYSPASLATVTVGQSVTLSVTIKNTGPVAWQFIAGATVWNSGGSIVADYSTTLSFNLQPGQTTTVNWNHTVNQAGDFWVQFGVWEGTPFIAENLLGKDPSPSQKLIVGQTAGKFQIGDRVGTTANLNVRTGPGTGFPEIDDLDYPGVAPSGAIGTVLDGPISANDFIWWRVQFDDGYTGWCAENWLEEA